MAGEFAYGAGYSLTYDSNITRVPNNAIAEWTQSLIGGFAYQERTIDVDARLLAQAERRDYLRNTYSDEKVYYVDGAAVWTISPRQFTWTVEDVAHQVRTDITTPDTPSNRTNANSLSTGPEFIFRLDPADTAVIGSRYGRFDIDGPGDNERYSGYARWLHSVSAQTTLSANYAATRVNYQDPSAFNNFLLEAWFLRYETRPSPNGMTIDFGTSRVTREGAEALNGRLARLTLLRQLTSESSLQVSFAEEYSDTGSDLLGTVTIPTQPTGGVPSTPATIVAQGDAYYSKRGDLAYVNQGGHFGIDLRGYARSIDYQTLNQDFDEHGGRFECSYLFSGETRLRAYTEYVRRTFLDFYQRDTLRNSAVGVTYRLTRNVNITAEAGLFEESSTLPSNNFVDRRVMLLLAYSSGPLYTVQSRR